ncbi:class I SAM-dependent methyltransferase [uncultured Sulfitobacter sp.]|uniref:class I SAM-dependent methyltransferase n=1 Tax=uncultured Sulfitobacter sp. TaxID=191468 RepID=UPI0026306709|nr:class I SAM-dependent methyltransferase [uncultured Sulfitobacter sp.]
MTSTAIADIGAPDADLDPSSDRYAQRFAGPAGEYLLSRQTQALHRFLRDMPGASILDVGGGHGQSARPLLAAGHPVTVLSSSRAAWGQIADMDHPGLRRQVGPLLQMPFVDRSFDVVVALRMMAHVGDWKTLLAEMTRVARRAVIIDFPLPGGANLAKPLLLWAKKRAEGNTRDYDTVARADVHACLGQYGFGVAGEVGQFVLPMVVHRMLKTPRVSQGFEAVLGAVGLDRVWGTPVILRADRVQ